MTYPSPWPWAPSGYQHRAVAVTIPPDDDDVLTVAELLARARIVPGDEEDPALMQSYIAAARAQVERDTGCALTTQTAIITFDQVCASGVLLLPLPPLQEVSGITYYDSEGAATVLEPDDVVRQLDVVSRPARLVWQSAAFDSLGTPSDLSPLSLLCVVGWTQATLPAPLRFAVGLLAAHYLTTGRDRVVIGTIVADMPAGYEEAIQPYRLEVVA